MERGEGAGMTMVGIVVREVGWMGGGLICGWVLGVLVGTGK